MHNTGTQIMQIRNKPVYLRIIVSLFFKGIFTKITNNGTVILSVYVHVVLLRTYTFPDTHICMATYKQKTYVTQFDIRIFDMFILKKLCPLE